VELLRVRVPEIPYSDVDTQTVRRCATLRHARSTGLCQAAQELTAAPTHLRRTQDLYRLLTAALRRLSEPHSTVTFSRAAALLSTVAKARRLPPPSLCPSCVPARPLCAPDQQHARRR
jgi:hypothetical protein